jgi:chromosome segregation ATPase
MTKQLKKELKKVETSIKYFNQEYEDCERHWLRTKAYMESLHTKKEELLTKIERLDSDKKSNQ